MKKCILFSSVLLVLFTGVEIEKAVAADGDTTVIQTFNFGTPQNDWFVFPSASKTFRKIYIDYTLKCNPNQSPNCGEWDYLTYTRLWEHTGNMDSNLLFHANFQVNGSTPDTFNYLLSPAWEYMTRWEYFITHNNVISLNTAVIGSGATTVDEPFDALYPDSKTQYLWRATELTAAGLGNGDITGLRFDIQATGSVLNRLTIKMKQTSEDTLVSSNFSTSGWTEVYSMATTFTSTGWQDIQFTTAFNWDSTLNLMVEICYDNSVAGTVTPVMGHMPSFKAGVNLSDEDHALIYEGKDFVEVPTSIFDQVDSNITISLWQYGDPVIQPQSDYVFEGDDVNGSRVVNSHLPWSDQNVYWDAGNDGGSYDRINGAANTYDYEGEWNHWAFTKDVRTGEMFIYLNGNLWLSGGGKIRDMVGITTFKIGSNADGNWNYDGMIDEFRIWNVTLDQATIKEWMNKDVNPTHPNFANLLAYYKFNEGTGVTTADLNSPSQVATLFGMPRWTDIAGCDKWRNVMEVNTRPNVVFEQGVYNSIIDSVLIVDSVMIAPLSLVLFSDTNNPTQATDTLLVWEPYYNNYIYDSGGNATDSNYVQATNTIIREDSPYYGDPYEVVKRWEIGRYITPYGNGLDLGAGFTWRFDVTDYASLLHDSVHLSAGNWQELLDMRFIMVEGTPPRTINKIENIYNGSFSYRAMADSTQVLPKDMLADPDSKTFRLITRTTGHGFNGGVENCAEFCAKQHSMNIDGFPRFAWYVWDECSKNALFPQGGTWVYDRGGWCPGLDVRDYVHELTPFVTPGDSFNIDYNVEPYPNGGGHGNYILEVQLISYGEPNFTLDASIEDIMAPNDWEYYGRKNPICGNPRVKIQNTGDTDLDSVTIEYGVVGGDKFYYTWEGDLEFLDTVSFELPPMNWNGINGNRGRFYAKLICVNGLLDQYEFNDKMFTNFEVPPVYDSAFVMILGTNNQAYQNSYYLMDEIGDTIYSRTLMNNNTTYRDTFRLDPGCYAFNFIDDGNNGLSWWANPGGGNGSVAFRRIGAAYYTFFLGKYGGSAGDFGGGIYHEFTVLDSLGKGEMKPTPAVRMPCEKFDTGIQVAKEKNAGLVVEVYPNPMLATATLIVNYDGEYSFTLFDLIGKEVMRQNAILNRSYDIVKGDLVPGVYFYEVRTKNGQIASGKLVIE
ncbi:MAG: T9SS type A sorting domain-containing protein [Bacteroidetes bacterium]|nr:T9SS type A sorting domain-containing protein [Bacteroidota bacterium]